jgi:cell division protein FtsB
MTWHLTLWNRVQSLGFVVFVSVVVFGVALLFLPLLNRRHVLRQELQRVDQEIARQAALEKQQQQDIEALRNDSAFLERTAREKLNLARPTELVFHFEPKPAVAPVTAAPRR